MDFIYNSVLNIVRKTGRGIARERIWKNREEKTIINPTAGDRVVDNEHTRRTTKPPTNMFGQRRLQR